MNTGSITVLSDQKKVVNRVNRDMIKTLQGVSEGVSSIFEIKHLLKLIPIRVQIKYIPKPKWLSTFEQDPKAMLLNDSNWKAK